MAQTIGSIDLNAFSDLYSDSTQYFWFESNSSATYGAGAHVTLVPDTSFISNPTGQNILMNTDGFSIRNGLLPMMTLDNDSLDFNVVNTTEGTYTPIAFFSSTGAQIGQSGAAHSVIDANGQRFYASDGTTQLANIGYGEGNSQSGTQNAPYYTFGKRLTTATPYSTTSTYAVGDLCTYDGSLYVCRLPINTPQAWTRTNWLLAIGNYSLAEGMDTLASGYYSHAEGIDTKTVGYFSHAEGNITIAGGGSAHSEGEETMALGVAAHSEGYQTIASGYDSHAQGVGTIANRLASTAIGLYNISDADGSDYTRGNYALIIGNGNSEGSRSNALTVDWDGKINCGDYSGTFKSIFDIFYPVGSYYETSLASAIPSGNSTPNDTDLANLGVTWFNPQYAWGGTWELELAGQVHVSSGTGYAVSGAETNTSDGGSKDAVVVSHNHTQNQHRHASGASDYPYFLYTKATATNSAQMAGGSTGHYSFWANAGGSFARAANTDYTTATNNSTGVNGTDKNMPPYIVVNRWHRIA